jgi:hypothetical protein
MMNKYSNEESNLISLVLSLSGLQQTVNKYSKH